MPGEIIQVGLLRKHQPLFLNVTVGKRELISMNPELQSGIETTRDDLIFDTILKEITNLKKAVKQLENRRDR